MSAPVRQLRVVSLVEGASLLVLLLIAMPLKYAAGMPGMVRVVGMVHGVLFVAFVVAVIRAATDADWGWGRTAKVMALSVVPLGMLVIDRELQRDLTRDATAG